MEHSDLLKDLFNLLPTMIEHHKPGVPLYNFFSKVARQEVGKLFHRETAFKVNFDPFGDLIFPYHKMGSIDSINLFDLDELIIFSFYWQNRNNYRKVVDIGANLGLHSTILSKCGFDVVSYEPDPTHFEILENNIALNYMKNITPIKKAVSVTDGEMDFIRVLGNTTGSHLSGSKPNPYGDLETIPIQTKSFKLIITDFDLVKMDAEGHEKHLISSTDASDWENVDGIISIHDTENAIVIFEHLNNLGVNIFSQKINWKKATLLDEMPVSHHEGSIFISSKNMMNWVVK
jgi:FkbM family methyltransferase